MTSEQQDLNWLDKELESSTSPAPYDKHPALKLQPNRVVELDVDFSKPFYKWEDRVHKSLKAVIPVKVNGELMSFWVNVKNPIYRTICEKGKKGITKVKIVQTGSQAETRYNLVE